MPAVLDHAEVTSDPHRAGVAAARSYNLLHLDGPAHAVLRRTVARFLSPQALDAVEPRLRSVRDQLASDCAQAAAPDLIADLVEPLVREAAFAALEVHVEDRAALTRLMPAMLGLLDPPEDADAGRTKPAAAMLRCAAVFHRRALEGTAVGLHAALLDLVARGHVASEDVAFTMPVVLHGGYENPLNFLGLLAAGAARDPSGFRARARAAPDELVEDELRVRNAVRSLVRWAAADLPAWGAQRGDVLWLDIEQAHETLGLGRHLAFGWGRHRCPGSHLARRLAGLLIGALLGLPDEVLAGARTHEHVSAVTRGVLRIAAGDRTCDPSASEDIR